jgi:hypothetical protein
MIGLFVDTITVVSLRLIRSVGGGRGDRFGAMSSRRKFQVILCYNQGE